MKYVLLVMIMQILVFCVNVEGETEKVSVPAYGPAGGSYALPQSVHIVCGTPGSAIMYTTNNTPPTKTNGFLYSEPLFIYKNTTIMAMAFAEGKIDSDIASATFIIGQAGVSSASAVSSSASSSVSSTSSTFSTSSQSVSSVGLICEY